MATTDTSPMESSRLTQGLLFAVGATALGVFAASRPLLGAGVYAVTALGVLVTQYRSTGKFLQLSGIGETQPGEITLVVVGLASAVVFPALVAASGLGYFEWTPIATGIALAVAGLYVVYGIFGFRASLQEW